jgi:protein-S-isoprenylcysteine O-methyltransferase Ste14
MSERMTRWGVGPWFAFWALAGALGVTLLDLGLGHVFTLPLLPAVRVAVGALLVVGGLVLYGTAALSVMRAYNADTLITHGAYGRCRHPVYAAWAVLVIPGVSLIANCWLGLLLGCGLSVLVRVLTVREDRYLEQRFGDAFRRYRRRVPAVLPLGAWGRV